MRKAVLFAALALAACGSGDQKDVAGNESTAQAGKAPEGNFVIKPPIQFSADPAEKQKQQEMLVGEMARDPMISLADLEGEAARRGVKLTPAQIADKKTQKPGDARPAPLPEANQTDNAAGQ